MDGRKYHSSPESYYNDVRGTSDAICAENDLSIIKPTDSGKHYAEWKAEKQGKPTVRGMIREDIDEIIADAFTYKSFTLKEELLKFDRYQRQFRFLQESRISTETELSMYSDALQAEADALTEQRRELYRLRKRGDDSVSPEIERITARLRELRRTQRLCGAIQGDIPAIRAMSTLDDERESQHDDRSKAHEKTHSSYPS